MEWIKRRKAGGGGIRIARDERGQSLIIVVLALVALMAFIGLGVDLGLVYVERVRLARAMDAAALAGAQELPGEEAAHQRALEYLEANKYDTLNACIETLGSNLAGGAGSCGGSGADTIIIVDTEQFRDGGAANSANRINVRASKQVALTFLRVVGFDTVPIAASSTAENIEDLDIVIVYDRSGSMMEDTRCHGCWEPDPPLPYREGTTYPLPYEIVPGLGVAVHCQASDPVNFEGYWYLSIEAEHYSQYLIEADYHMDRTELPKTWWTMQRAPGVNASGPDARGAFMKLGPHMGFANHVPSIGAIVHPTDPDPFLTTPRLDYDFTVPQNGTYYVWMRAQGGPTNSDWPPSYIRRQVYVGLNGAPLSTGVTRKYSSYNQAADAEDWRWTDVLEMSGLIAGQNYTLNFWGAGPGFSLDKIVITSDPRDQIDQTTIDPHTHRLEYYPKSWSPLGWTYNGIDDGGPQETHGRTGWACMGALDPRFGPINPDTGELDDLYDDHQPIRAAKEAAKAFVRRLNPEIDQIGYVTYSTSASILEELYCVKHYGSCADFENVVASIESTRASGSTNIGEAMWYGLRVLTTGEEPDFDPDGEGFPPRYPGTLHYGRPSAAHIMVLMTDGQANYVPSWWPSGYETCYSGDLWPDVPGENPSQRNARECVAWFAQQARDMGVVIYTIGLGAQADNELLAHVADITGGWYYYAPNAAELDEIFESLYERIFLRLTE